MREQVIDISTEVFHEVQLRAPGYVSWGEEKPGPTQKILVPGDVYSEFIDRAIAHRQTLDEVIHEACTRGLGGNQRSTSNVQQSTFK
jgi:hypothetical protein